MAGAWLNPHMNRVLFNVAEAAVAASWQPINDAVMGGVSVSSLRFDPAGHAVFEGSVSFERNGGFASVRCLPQAFSASTDLYCAGAVSRCSSSRAGWL